MYPTQILTLYPQVNECQPHDEVIKEVDLEDEAYDSDVGVPLPHFGLLH